MQKIHGILQKYQEQILYLVFGFATTIVNWGTYTLALTLFSLTVSNSIAWVFAVFFAYFVNKVFVFKKRGTDLAGTIREIVLFFSARIASGVLEIGGLPLLVYIGLDQEIYGIEGAVAKVLLSVIVVILNYIFSKFIIFKRKMDV
jgi:putative flippase GtrA